MKNTVVWTAILLLCRVQVEACGPGRGLGRPGNRMKLTPLVFKQHVPNVSEFTLGASGLSERRITRTDPRFRNLVPVYSDDIIFRDEEGTGADRFMTQRCVEKLKALAISVMNQWPSLKLRVVDGWIENVRPGYPNDSLHYEGRAVDITTSDRDRSKIGMLARLAVEAGFDWVYYETKAHIHCSVKSESSQGARTGGCFTSEGTVVVEGGTRKKLSEVRLGDRVLSYDTGSGKLVYSEVIMFLDRDTTARKQFLRLGLSGGQVLTVTPQHLVMRNRPNSTDQDVEAVFAANLKPSDQLLVAENNGTKLLRRTLLSSELVLDEGIIAPLTSVGTIVVDDVIASCYAVIESQSIAHFAFAPLRALRYVEAGLGAVGRLLSSPFASSMTTSSPMNASLTSNAITDGAEEGVHWYPKTLYYLSNHFIPSYLLYN